jgi:hypothetical protein
MEQRTHRCQVMVDGEMATHPRLSSRTEPARYLWITHQLSHRFSHTRHITLLHQKTGGAINDHLWNPGMACGHYRESAQLGFHHRHRASFTISVGCHQ